MLLLLLGLLLTLPLLVCIVLLWRTRPDGPLALRIARGLGLCTLCAAPAILVQDALLLSGATSTTFEPLVCLTALPFQVWVLLGGGVVQQVFEETAKSITGHRQATMMDNWYLYYAFTLAWALPWSALLAWRLRSVAGRRDLLVGFVAVVLLANAVAGTRWPWWGS